MEDNIDSKYHLLQNASDEMKKSRSIVMAAVSENGLALQYAARELQEDPEIISKALDKLDAPNNYSKKNRDRPNIVRKLCIYFRDSKPFFMVCLKQEGMLLHNASNAIKNDKEVVLVAVKQRGISLEFSSEELRSDHEVVLQAVRQHWSAIKYASLKMRHDREIAMEAVEQNGQAFEIVHEHFNNDFDIVLTAVSSHADAFIYASATLKDNYEIVITAVAQSGFNLQHASQRLKSDNSIVLAAIRQSSGALQYAGIEPRENLQVMLEAVQQSGHALEFASSELRNNKELVLLAVGNTASSLQFASDVLRQDPDVLEIVIKCSDWRSIEFASKEAKSNKLIMKMILDHRPMALKYASDELKNDLETVLNVVSLDGIALEYASEHLRNHHDVVLAAVNQNHLAFHYAGDELKRTDKEVLLVAVKHFESLKRVWDKLFQEPFINDDFDIMLEVVKQNGLKLSLASTCLRRNVRLVFEAIVTSDCPQALKFAAKELKNNKELVLKAVSLDGLVVRHASANLRKDYDVMLAAVKQSGIALEYAGGAEDASLSNNKDVVLAAVKQSGYSLQFASDLLRNDNDVVLAAVRQRGGSLRYASYALRANINMCIEALYENNHGEAMMYCLCGIDNESHENAFLTLEQTYRNRPHVSKASYGVTNASSREKSRETLRQFVFTAINDGFDCTVYDFLSTFLFGLQVVARVGLTSFQEKEVDTFSTDSNFQAVKTTSQTEVVGNANEFVAVNINRKNSNVSTKTDSALIVLTRMGKYPLLDVKKLVGEYVGLQLGETWRKLNHARTVLEYNTHHTSYNYM